MSPLRDDYRGIAGNPPVDISHETIAPDGTNYGIGFGGGDLRRALEEYTAQSVLEYLRSGSYTGTVPDGIMSQLIDEVDTENASVTEKHLHPMWELAAKNVIAAVQQQGYLDEEKAGWMENVIINAYGDDADVSINAIQTLDDVHDLIWNLGQNHWEQQAKSGLAIHGMSPYSPDYEGYKPVTDKGKTQGRWLDDWAHSGQVTVGPGQTITDIEPVPGAGFPGYGWDDYTAKLEEIWNASGNDVSTLHNYREAVLDYLTNSPSNVSTKNKPVSAGGDPNGLHAIITSHKRGNPRNPRAPLNLGDINLSPAFGGRLTEEDKELNMAVFTQADYLAARAGGHNDYDIYRHLLNNPQQYNTNTEAEEVYNRIRTNLINTSPLYTHSNNDEWLARLENPIWQEVGKYLTENAGKSGLGIPERYSRYNWHDWEDYGILKADMYKYLTAAGQEVPADGERWTEDHLAMILGNVSGNPRSYDPGEYWSQWGAVGPGDDPDSPGDRDLLSHQKWRTLKSLENLDRATAKNRLEYLEEKFLNELYEGDPTDPDVGPAFATAGDDWGLDIRRMNFSWGDASWDDNQVLRENAANEEWYTHLTKGAIDWGYYQDSSLYQEAKTELGLKGTYTATSLGVAGIREANVWITAKERGAEEGQISSEVTDAWEEYEAEFTLPDTIPDRLKGQGEGLPSGPFVPEEVDIPSTIYTPESLKTPKTPSPAPAAPVINIPDVEIKRPSNLSPRLGRISGEQ